MRVTLPAGDGLDLSCPHQFVGYCDACSAKVGVKAEPENSPAPQKNPDSCI